MSVTTTRPRRGRLIAGGAAVAAMLGSLLLIPAGAASAADVGLLQRDLAGLSYAPLSGVDGVYGPQTKESVRHFQQDNGLAVDGDAGPATLSALTGKVKQVQHAAGTGADGDYGSGTLKAVKAYQAGHGLDQDGIAGPATMGRMGIDRVTASGPGHSSNTQLLQRGLVGLGYLPAGSADGVYGASTKNAVLEFQSDNDLQADGIAGPQTDAALDAKVKEVQRAAGTGADGDYGDGTTRAVRAYQAAHGLGQDGIAGPDTMEKMGIARSSGGSTHGGGSGSGGNPSVPPLSGGVRDKIIQAARSQLGVRDWGTDCNPYGPCESWCALFASWSWRQAGVDFSTAFSGDFYYYGQRHGTLRTGDLRKADPKPGDAIVFGSGPQNTNTSVHVGIIESVNGDGSVTTIEGNHHHQVQRVHRLLSGGWPAYAIVSPAG